MKPMTSDLAAEPVIPMSSPVSRRERNLEEGKCKGVDGGSGYYAWTVEEVLTWLTESKISDKTVHAAFKSHHIDGEVLFYLTEEQLKEIIPSTGLRTKFMIARHKLADATIDTLARSPPHGLVQGLTWHHHGSSKHLLSFGRERGTHAHAHHSYMNGHGWAGAYSPRAARANPPPLWSPHGHDREQFGRQAQPDSKSVSEGDILERLSKALEAKDSEFSLDDVGNLTPWQREADEKLRNVAGGIVFVVELALNFIEPIFGHKVHPALHLIVLLPLILSVALQIMLMTKV